MTNIKIHVFHCGTMRLSPKETYIKESHFSKRIELPNTVYLIQHPVHGNILVDTGWSYEWKGILPSRLQKFYEPDIKPGCSALDNIKKLGLKPEDIDLLLLTHLDIDHTCALKDFVGRAKRIACAELEYFYSCRTVYKMRQVWDTWMPYEKNIERIYYRASTLGPVGRGFDLFGDDSVICIYCPGHTDGIFATVVSQGPSNRFNGTGDGIYGGNFAVLASDLAFSERNLDYCVIPGYGFDRKQQLNAIDFLCQLRKDPKCKGILCSHDPSVKEGVVII